MSLYTVLIKYSPEDGRKPSIRENPEEDRIVYSFEENLRGGEGTSTNLRKTTRRRNVPLFEETLEGAGSPPVRGNPEGKKCPPI